MAPTCPDVVGEFMHPVINSTTQNSDPWQRNYSQPPVMEQLVARSYPLIDIRPTISQPDYSPLDLLRTHGFCYVKQSSKFIKNLDAGVVSDSMLGDIYHPEIIDLVIRTLGCKEVIIQGSVFRQGKRVPEPYALPLGLRPMTGVKSSDGRDTDPPQHKLANQSKLILAAPYRVPHMDFTPLGARQTIRHQALEINDLARDIIVYEDAMLQGFEGRPVATTHDADEAIAARYNSPDQIASSQLSTAPRYAAFSIWRPLRRVGRDPLTLSPRMEFSPPPNDFVHCAYLNRTRGDPKLGGDYLKEFAMLGVKGDDLLEQSVASAAPDPLKFYYVSAQEPDEVLFIKLFDSAALGTHDASAPWHGSPEIGSAGESDDPRESIDIRVMVFW